jgi:hypothetical protein
VPKKISNSAVIGQQGIHIIGEISFSMGLPFYSTGGVEAGIDGFIEIRDDVTGEVTNSIIQVQSKATQQTRLQAETETSFEYRCEQRDIDYWLQGNAPVILIVVKVRTREAYWVSLKDYFKDPEKRRSRKIIFNKQRERFDQSCRDALIRLAISENSGIYLAPIPTNERLYSNLLKVSYFSEYIYIAKSKYQDIKTIYRKLDLPNSPAPDEWKLKEDYLISFHDLNQEQWHKVCDSTTVKALVSAEWASSSDTEIQRDFVWLLNRALRKKFKQNLNYSKEKNCYYFRPTLDLSTLNLKYKSITNRTDRDVFKAYKKKNSDEIAFYRHSAFEGFFKRFGKLWYLEITPTYFFTSDGYRTSKYFDENLKGIKRLEKHSAVFGQLVMWASFLKEDQQTDMFKLKYPFIEFGELEALEMDVGIDDARWLKNEVEEDANLLTQDCIDDLPLFRQSNET